MQPTSRFDNTIFNDFYDVMRQTTVLHRSLVRKFFFVKPPKCKHYCDKRSAIEQLNKSIIFFAFNFLIFNYYSFTEFLESFCSL